MKTLRVELAHGRGYPVRVGSGVLQQASEFAPAQCVLITDSKVKDLYGDKLLQMLQQNGRQVHMLQMHEGEAHKTMETVQQLLDGMLQRQLGRDSGVIALGGGVVGDVAGFAAAIYMRGITLLQIPTTLLAQVDAAIGGKTGVNHLSGKNLIGAFHQPCAVLADTDTLATLEAREYYAGLAEVVKYGLLGDAEFFGTLEAQQDALRNRDKEVLEEVIAASIQAKARIVAADETERSGQRALLNLGHTFAHAVETVYGYGTLLHGEAVAIGLVAAATLSAKVCGFPAADVERIRALLTALRLPVHTPAPAPIASFLDAMAMDKKNQDSEKRFVLMRRIGEAFVSTAADAAVREVLEDF